LNLEKITSPSQGITASHVPSIELCRFFKKPCYVDDFNEGKYRFGNLEKYRSAELDRRSDPTEGESLNYCSDGSQYGSFSSGCYYALCFTELNRSTNIDNLANKFGANDKPAICISIQDNFCLTRNILAAWGNSIDKYRIAYFRWHKVEYNKNELGEYPPLQDNNDLHCYQKPKCHIIHCLKRIRQTPLPPPKPNQPEIIDLGGDIGSIHEFSSLNPIAMKNYETRLNSGDYKILEPKINNFEIEQEWRLTFFSGNGYNYRTGKVFKTINAEHYTLS